jgi:hemolysin activation/secretion protein
MIRPNYLFLFLLIFPNVLFAASPLQPNGDLGGILQQQFEKQLPKFNLLPEPVPSSLSEKPIEESKDEVLVLIKGFRFEGVSLISEEEIQQGLKPWIGQKSTLKDLQKAADQIAELYHGRHFLVQTTIPPQEINPEEGVILIQVLEAKLGAIRIESNENARFDSRKSGIANKYFTYGNKLGEYVNTEQIERTIYLINELPGVAVATEIEPGDKDGEVALKVRLADKALFNGSVGLTNYGNSSTGLYQMLGSLSINNPGGFGDQITLNTVSSAGSEYGQLGYSMPIGVSGLRGGLTLSSMYYATLGNFVGSQGSANTWGFNLNYPLLRTQATNANLSFAYQNKTNTNNNLTTGSLVSDYLINEYTFGFSGNHYDYYWGGGVTNLSLNVISGDFTILPDALGSSYGIYTAPTFSKLTYALTRNQQIIPDKMILNVNVSGQFASGNLDAIERFYLGGPNGLRAYPSSQGSGDQGIMLNLDFQYQFPGNILGYVFYDIGMVQQYKEINTYNALGNNFNAGNLYSLSGFGVGIKYNSFGVNLNGAVAYQLGNNPLFRYDNLAQNYQPQNNDGTSNHLYFWLQANYPF